MTLRPDAIWSLPGQNLGRQVHVFNSLDSTNTLAMSLGNDPALHGLALLARAQSAGRGQYGRTWQAPPGSSVLLSVLLFPPRHLQRPALLTAWAAVSVCETIGELTGLSTQIKWPNDVLIDGKKVCGILIEQRTTGQADFPLAAVVGVGLNVTQSPDFFEQANLPDATSLGIASRRVFDLAAVAKSLLQQLDPQYQRLIDGAEAALEAMWNARLGLLGKMVVAECIQHRHEGRLVSSAFAALEIENQDGSVVRLAPESIRTLRLLD